MARIAIDCRMVSEFQHGISRHVSELVRGFAVRQTDHVFLLVMNRGQDYFPDISGRGFEKVHIRSSMLSPMEHVELADIMNFHRIELFHSPSYVAPLICPAKLVVTIHDLIHLLRPEEYTLLHRLYYKTIVRLNLVKASRVITVSEAARKDIMHFYGNLYGKIRVVPNGVSKDFSPGICTEEVRRKYNLPEKYVFFLGSAKKHKNLAGVLAAVGKTPGISLVVAGVEGNSQASNISILGRVPDEDLVDLYRGCEFFVYPSFIEGFGFNPLEAMACGKPVIVSRNTSLPEVAGDAADYVDPGDIDDISARMASLWSDESRKRELGASGLKRAAEFTWEKAVEKTLEVYEECLFR